MTEILANVDVAILTVLPQEYQAVRGQLTDAHDVAGTAELPNDHVWAKGRVPSPLYGGNGYSVALGMAGEAGTDSGVLVVTNAIARWDPNYILFVGIAGGVREKGLLLGDIAVSELIVGYEYGNIRDGAFLPRPNKTFRADLGLVNCARKLAEEGTWSGRLEGVSAEILSNSAPDVRLGLIASGDKVVDDLSYPLIAAIMKAWPNILAVEMEGAGAARAVDEATKKIRFLMIRGISDLPRASPEDHAESVGNTGTSQRDTWKPYAASVAAAFAISLIEGGLPTPPRVPETRQTTHRALAGHPGFRRPAEVAYLNYLLRMKEEWDKKWVPLFSGELREFSGERVHQETEVFIPPSLVPVLDKYSSAVKSDERMSFDSLEAVLAHFPCFSLLGPPGSGKSIILKKHALDAAARAAEDPLAPIPLLIRLGKDWPEGIGDIADLLRYSLGLHGLGEMHPSELLILFDGLDEIGRKSRAKKTEALASWLARPLGLSAVLSCRTNRYPPNLASDLPMIRIDELDEVKIRAFVKVTLRDADTDAVMHQLEPDPETPSRSSLMRLARNPFFLRMLALTYDPERGRFPPNEGDLFKDFVEALYRREQGRGTTGALSLEDVVGCLATVAQRMHEHGEASGKMDVAWANKCFERAAVPKLRDLWQLASDMSVLEITDDNRQFAFYHSLLAQYFAAEYLRRKPEAVRTLVGRPTFWRERRSPGEWDDVVHMLVGIAKSPDALLAVIGSVDPFLAADALAYVEDSKGTTLSVGGALLDSLARSLLSRTRDEREAAASILASFPDREMVVVHLRRMLEKGSDLERRRAAEVLSRFVDVPSAAMNLGRALIDKDKWVRRIVFDGLVNEFGGQAVDSLHQLFTSTKVTSLRCEIIRVWSNIPEPRCIEYICEAIQDKDDEVARRASEALLMLGGVEADAVGERLFDARMPARAGLSRGGGSERVRFLAVLAVAGTKDDFDLVASMLNDDDVQIRVQAIDTLANIGDLRAVGPLLQILTDQRGPSISRSKAADALGLLRDRRASAALLDALGDSNSFVCSSAARALGRIRVVEAVKGIAGLLENPAVNHVVRSYAALALGMIGDGSAVTTLRSATGGYKERIRGWSALGLAFVGGLDATAAISRMTHDPSLYVRQDVAVALGVLRDPEACQALSEMLLSDPEHFVRQWAALALGAIGTSDALHPLERALHDPISFVRKKATVALGAIKEEEAAELLVGLIADPDQYVRQQAVLGLGRLGAFGRIEALLGIRNDENQFVCAAVAWTLGQLNDDRGIQRLLEMLGHTSYVVRENAAEALGKIGNASPAIVEALMERATISKERVDFVRRFAVMSLGKLGAANSLELLRRVRRTDPSFYVRRAAIAAIRMLPGATDQALAEGVKDENPFVRYSAVKGLEERRSPRLAALISDADRQTISDEFEDARSVTARRDARTVARRLVEDGYVYKVLEQALSDPREEKRNGAARAIWDWSPARDSGEM